MSTKENGTNFVIHTCIHTLLTALLERVDGMTSLYLVCFAVSRRSDPIIAGHFVDVWGKQLRIFVHSDVGKQLRIFVRAHKVWNPTSGEVNSQDY